jgi:CRP-like cAMP-binding protein
MMTAVRSETMRSLRTLAGVSWLTTDQLTKLSDALAISGHGERSIIFSDKSSVESARFLLSGVARITCDNRKGERTTAIMLAPGLIPAFPTAVRGVTCNFRCEAITTCQIGTIGMNSFIKICLGISSKTFKLMAASFLGRWDRVYLRCANLLGYTLEERLALVLLDLAETFGVPNDDGGVRLILPLRHTHLAGMVGATRPRVTGHLASLTQKRLISLQDQRWVVDRKGLLGFLAEAHAEARSGGLA